MVDLRALGEGMSLGGVYTLERCLQDDRTGTFFAVLRRDGERLLAKLVPEQDPDAERQFATWQRTRHLRHPHLLHLIDVDSCELAGDSYVYGIFEYPDDVLNGAIEQGPLSEPETREVMESALGALRYLHGQGLVHGAVDPEHIVAVGDNIKLSTDGLRESEDLEGCLEDVRQLGELVRRLRAPEPLNEPLATIVRHATAADPRHRWTLAEIARVIDAHPVPIPVAAVTPTPLPPVETPITPPAPEPVSPAAFEPVSSNPTPVQPRMPEPVPPILSPVELGMAESIPPVSGQTDARSPGGFPKWIIAGMAILLLSILMFNLRRKPDAPADLSPVTPTAQAAVRPVTPPDAIAPRAETAPPPAIARPAVKGNWRVIAFTFRFREMAAKKAKQLNEKWPDLGAAVFAPKGHREYYLVALGDWMTREEAERVQRKVRRLGLPRDTYVQNYSD
jgi:eukaryotic-like serine/threonine-protein kinase